MATSVGHERVFSMAGHVVNSRTNVNSLSVKDIFCFNGVLKTKHSHLTGFHYFTSQSF